MARNAIPKSEWLADVVWSGERYVAVGRNGLIMHSDDGTRWARANDSATSSHLHGVAWSGEALRGGRR